MKNEKTPVIEQLPAQPVAAPEMNKAEQEAQAKIIEATTAFEDTVTKILEEAEQKNKDAAKETMPV